MKSLVLRISLINSQMIGCCLWIWNQMSWHSLIFLFLFSSTQRIVNDDFVSYDVHETTIWPRRRINEEMKQKKSWKIFLKEKEVSTTRQKPHTDFHVDNKKKERTERISFRTRRTMMILTSFSLVYFSKTSLIKIFWCDWIDFPNPLLS